MAENAPPKQKMNDEERRQLMEKLDQDLEDFINSREKKPYTEGWSEENWREEMEKHPFFMTKFPEPGEEVPPLLEAFQQLKYDPNENTEEDLALAYKDDGNFNFKLKKYNYAIANYTEAIKINCPNKDVNATLHLNRAAAHYHLQNYRSAYNDSLAAAKLKPDYMKAIVRAAQCCEHLKRFDEGLQWCDYGLRLVPTEKTLVELRGKLTQAKKTYERDRRRAQIQEKKIEQEEEALLKAIKQRKIAVGSAKGKPLALTMQLLEPSHPAALRKRVRLENDSLIWPVLFLYPEYCETDLIEEFYEDSTFLDHLEVMFGSEKPEWDVEAKYSPENLRIYYEDIEQKLHKVNPTSTLRQVLQSEGYVVRAGTPGFIILVEGSPSQRDFLKRYEMA